MAAHARIKRGDGTPEGFALLVMLWVIVSAGALTTVVTMLGRDSYHAARNRVNSERAIWRAESCLAHALATIDDLLIGAMASPALGASVWRSLDTAVTRRGFGPIAGCSVVLEAAGSRVDVNGDEAPLRRALGAVVGNATAASLVDALADWRDIDTIPRPQGAEASWYTRQSRYPPGNDTIPDFREVPRIRGFEQLAGLEQLLGVEPGRISIANAPPAVLAAVPGFTGEIVALILSWRARGWEIIDLLALEASLTRASADSLRANFPEIARLTALEPDAWIVTSTGTAGAPADSATIELRIVRTQTRGVVVRRREWL